MLGTGTLACLLAEDAPSGFALAITRVLDGTRQYLGALGDEKATWLAVSHGLSATRWRWRGQLAVGERDVASAGSW